VVGFVRGLLGSWQSCRDGSTLVKLFEKESMRYALTVSYWIIVVVLTFVFSLIDPQLLVIPLGLLLYLMRVPLRAVLKYLPLSFAYVLFGTILGLLVEIFAILNYFHNPKNSHLFSLNPTVDLTIALGFYCVTTIAIYLIVRKIEFGNIGFLICSAIYAIVIEQQGAVRLMGIANPILAPIFWLYVSIVYAVFTWGTYAMLQERFSARRPARWWAYLFLLAAMWTAAFVGALIGTGLSKVVSALVIAKN